MELFEMIDRTVPVKYIRCKKCGSLKIGCAKTFVTTQTEEQKTLGILPKTECVVVCGGEKCQNRENMDFDDYLKALNPPQPITKSPSR